MRTPRVKVRKAAVENDRPIGVGALQRMNERMVERRNCAIVLGAQSLEPGFARMNDKRSRARRLHRFREGEQSLARLLLVDAGAALHRDRNVNRPDHRGDAFGDKLRLAHEACAEAAALHPVGRTAAIEIDLVIAEVRTDARGFRKPSRIGAAKLQRHGMLARIKADEALTRAEHHRIRGDHLGIEKGAAREDAMERPATSVGPVHHRSHAKLSF